MAAFKGLSRQSQVTTDKDFNALLHFRKVASLSIDRCQRSSEALPTLSVLVASAPLTDSMRMTGGQANSALVREQPARDRERMMKELGQYFQQLDEQFVQRQRLEQQQLEKQFVQRHEQQQLGQQTLRLERQKQQQLPAKSIVERAVAARDAAARAATARAAAQRMPVLAFDARLGYYEPASIVRPPQTPSARIDATNPAMTSYPTLQAAAARRSSVLDFPRPDLASYYRDRDGD